MAKIPRINRRITDIDFNRPYDSEIIVEGQKVGVWLVPEEHRLHRFHEKVFHKCGGLGDAPLLLILDIKRPNARRRNDNGKMAFLGINRGAIENVSTPTIAAMIVHEHAHVFGGALRDRELETNFRAAAMFGFENMIRCFQESASIAGLWTSYVKLPLRGLHSHQATIRHLKAKQKQQMPSS
jgi:Zn-dependent protease with chaperone function